MFDFLFKGGDTSSPYYGKSKTDTAADAPANDTTEAKPLTAKQSKAQAKKWKAAKGKGASNDS